MNFENFTITNKTKGKLPRLPFVSIKNAILGEKYEVSVTCISSRKQRELNSKFRNKDSTTNILSFPLSKNSGEITLDLNKIKKEAVPLFGMSYSKFLKYLLIHGFLHLKGYEHSSRMEIQEEKFLKQFS
jgi:probable rRNA maturation factor